MMNFEMPPGGDVEVEKYRLENEKPEMSTTCESFKIMIHEKKTTKKKKTAHRCVMIHRELRGSIIILCHHNSLLNN